MSHQINVNHTTVNFEVEDGESVLEAAIRQGINLPYRCRNGACGACKGKITQGQVKYIKEPRKLTDDEKTNGMALFCSCTPESDLDIDIQIIDDLSELEIKIYPCRIQKMYKMADDVMYLGLKIPNTERMQFLPGQYIDILLPDGRKRSFSLANAPHHDELLELHIRHVEGGYFTTNVFNTMQQMDLMRIEGPHGNFYFREKSTRPVIMMAGGTGFAPVKSIVEHVIAEKFSLPVYIYWGAREKQDLYQAELAEQWSKEVANISFIPVLSRAENSKWEGRTGYVHDAICEDFETLIDYDVYACGPPAMVTAGEQAFKQKNLPQGHYYFDSFDFAEN